jgi:hypothetical protein
MDRGKHGRDNLHAAQATNAYLASSYDAKADRMGNALSDGGSRQKRTAMAAKPPQPRDVLYPKRQRVTQAKAVKAAMNTHSV